MRSQLLRLYLVQRSAVCAPAASLRATSSAFACSSASSQHSDTRPMRSASSPADLLAQQQVVLRLRHAAQQRPDDRRVVARGDAQARVAVDDARVLRGDRDVGEQPRHQPRADRRAVHRRDHDLRAVDDVVDEVARLAPDARARLEVLTSCPRPGRGRRRPRSPCPRRAGWRRARRGRGRRRARSRPARRACGRVGGARACRSLVAHHDLEDAGLGPAELQGLVVVVVHGCLLACSL